MFNDKIFLIDKEDFHNFQKKKRNLFRKKEEQLETVFQKKRKDNCEKNFRTKNKLEKELLTENLEKILYHINLY